MRSRSRIRSIGRDKKIFRKTAARKNVKNIPGHVLTRGGITL